MFRVSNSNLNIVNNPRDSNAKFKINCIHHNLKRKSIKLNNFQFCQNVWTNKNFLSMYKKNVKKKNITYIGFFLFIGDGEVVVFFFYHIKKQINTMGSMKIIDRKKKHFSSVTLILLSRSSILFSTNLIPSVVHSMCLFEIIHKSSGHVLPL